MDGIPADAGWDREAGRLKLDNAVANAIPVSGLANLDGLKPSSLEEVTSGPAQIADEPLVVEWNLPTQNKIWPTRISRQQPSPNLTA